MSNGVVADSHRLLATGKRGGKKNMSESKTVVMSSSGSGSVSVSLSVTYIYTFIYIGAQTRDITWNSLYVLPAAPVAPTRVMECATGSCRASMNSNSNRTYATDTIA